MKKLKYQFILSAGAVLFASAALTGCSTDDSFDGSSAVTNNDQNEIGFSPYVGQAATRASVYDAKSLSLASGREEKNMVGVFAMKTTGKKYDATATDGSTETVFTPNFMDNIGLYYNWDLSAGQSYPWMCSAARYWPVDSTQYVSFTAYAPYKDGTQLYSKSGDTFTAGGDAASYLKAVIPADKAEQTDLLYTDIKETSNMRYYSKDGGATYVEDGGKFLSNFSEEGRYGVRGPKVLLTLKHATARIAIDISSSSLDNADGNDYKDPKTYNISETKGNQSWEYTNTRIIVNKVMLLGDNTSAESANPTGAFYGGGYLNLATATTDNPLWVINDADGKVACKWDNTGANLETVRGEGYFCGGHPNWLPNTGTSDNDLKDTDAPSIPGNEICGWRKGASYSSTHDATEIGNKSDGYLFVIPQDFTGETDKLYCYIDYTVKLNDTGDEQNVKTYIPISQNFEVGKAYRICIDINPGKKIHFAVDVENWPNELNVNVKNQ